ncbi:MAG: PKD domain-containing protein, partial [Bacteroidetes bacterium]|nr:PKD domain-containing protein [Bacteroidota bacterium]
MRVLLFLILGLVAIKSYAQPCPKVLDNEGDPSSNPYWYSCAGGDFTFNLQTLSNWGDVAINWGDGSAVQNVTAFNSGSIIPHVYAATVDTFIVTIDQLSSTCLVTGVVVMEQPTAASIQIPFGFDTQACVPASLFFTNSSTNVSQTTVFEWDFGDGTTATYDASNLGQTIDHFYEPGTVNCETEVTLTAENYCNTLQGNPSIATFNPIHLWDKDQPNIGTASITKCYPDTTFSFTNTGTRNCYNQGNIYPRLLQWTFGTQAEVGTNTTTQWYPFPPNTPRVAAFPGVGDYTIILLDSSYCGIASDTQIVHIIEPPIANFSLSQDTVCVGQNVTFTPLNTGGNTYAWNFNGTWTTLPSGPVNYAFTAAGTYTVSFRISDSASPTSCVDEATMDIVVLPAPSATITYSGDVGCDSLQVTFGLTSVGSPTSFQWDFDNGQTYTGANPPAQWFVGGGQYDVVLNIAANNGCVGTSTKTITINNTPTAGFSVSNPCVGQTVTFNQESTGNPSNYNWNFGNSLTSTQSSPTTTYNAAGDYNVRLIARRGTCRDTLYQTITVFGLPTAQFTSSETMGCSPLLVDFTNASAGAVDYLWDFGDSESDTLENTSHTFYALGSTNPTYNVQLTVTSEHGCTHTVSHPITIIAGALADFHLENPTPTCSPQAVSFVNDSQNAVGYSWDFDDNQTSTETNPDHVFNATGVNVVFYDVQLIAYSNGACHDTTTVSVAVFPAPDFTMSTQNLSGCSPLNVTMPFILGATQFQWNFGDGGTSTLPQPQHTFVSTDGLPVTYTIQLIARSPFGCYDTLQSTIDVAGAPTTNFEINLNQACEPAVIEVYNLSANGTGFTWNWGDGNTEISDEDTLTHPFTHPDDFVHYYNITLSTSSVNGCSSTAVENFTLYPEVNAAFTVMNPTQNCSPYPAAFQNNSTAANQYVWTFGDGNGSNLNSPTHTYANPIYQDTTYQVMLVALSNEG